jgi:DNA-binding response OmpR family regulator
MTRILIVEDDRATSGLLKTIFEMEGYKTSVCPDPDRVVEVTRRDKPDLIFMDYHLAEQESLSILREIKADEELKGIPVIMTSGLDRSEECREAGAASFLIKPFRPASLMDEIHAVLDEKSSS